MASHVFVFPGSEGRRTVADVFEAIEEGDADRLRELVEREPELAAARNASGLSAVLAASYRWRQDLVDVLLAAGPELDVFEAAAVGDNGRLRELLAASPELANSWAPDGFTPLQLASYFGQVESARLLLERGADVNAVARNTMAVMPIHAASAT